MAEGTIVVCDALRAVAESLAAYLEREGFRVVATVSQAEELTSEEEAEPLHALITAGVDGLISKRRGLDEIVTAIDRLHTGTGYYDPVLVRHAVTTRRPKQGSAAPELTGSLTPRELEVLHQLVRGASTGGMAAAMGISVTTVRSHTQAVLSKLGVNSRLQAAACAVSYGLVEPHA